LIDRVETQWCVDCGARFTEEEVAEATCCPRCRSNGVPCSAAQDLRVEVNWHELRILAIWAENWARRIEHEPANIRAPGTVQAIARRLEGQHPSLTRLTLSGELADLPKALADAGISTGPVHSTIEPPPTVRDFGPGAVGHVA